jgi:hypothetical protein
VVLTNELVETEQGPKTGSIKVANEGTGEDNMGVPKPCGMKRDLLREYGDKELQQSRHGQCSADAILCTPP